MTRRRWTAEEKIRIVLESLNTSIGIAELCRKYAVLNSRGPLHFTYGSFLSRESKSYLLTTDSGKDSCARGSIGMKSDSPQDWPMSK
jgi:hypothetical protein